MNATDLSALTAHGGWPMQVILAAELFEAAVVRFDDAAGVMDVWEKDPAHESGLPTGDIVTSVDGDPAVSVDPPRFRELLQQQGGTVRLGVARGADTTSVAVKTRRII